MPTLSYWEREDLLRCDVIVVGAGIIGLSTAISILEKNPGYYVTVLEREIIPSGASTKNAGFACYGSITEILHEIQTKGQDAAFALVEQRKHGMGILLQRLGHRDIGYEACGGYELLTQQHASAIESIGKVNELLQPLFGDEYFQRCDERLDQFGFSREFVHHLIYTKHEGSIRSGRMMRELARLASERGVRIITGAEVRSIDESSDMVRVEVQRHAMNDTVEFSCQQLVFCTNALALSFMKDCNLQPARGQILVTEAIPSLNWPGVFHFDAGYYYFRVVDHRILFGGGRNLDFEAEATDVFETTQPVQEELERLLRHMILPGLTPKIESRWAGIMGFSSDSRPRVAQLSARTTVAFGCNGMGVALGSAIGESAASLVHASFS